MYDKFFGFKERPFQLVPNPAYLFLSKSHEEAIAHLRYAISHGDGFVEISGEVGTGKTTLCRAFLDELDDTTEVAYIFNPQLDAVELLKAVNDEFGISSGHDTIKELIDTLNTFLIEKKAAGKSAILLIDEAQNLDKSVLEQIRLLSNLETNTGKLLQIILVGQPELQKLLDSYDLRQLRQRITLSWYLTPMSPAETREYIRHRINIASQKTEDKFTESAYHVIYKYSRGIPRLINIVCDRALLTAFGFNKRKVTRSIAAAAVEEITRRGGHTPRLLTPRRLAVAAAVLVCLITAAAFTFKFPFLSSNSSSTDNNPANNNSTNNSSTNNTATQNQPQTLPAPHPIPTATERPAVPQENQTSELDGILANLTGPSSRSSAVKTVFALWKTAPNLNPALRDISDNQSFFSVAASQNNFQLYAGKNEWHLIKKLNLPVVLEFLPPGAESPRYLALVKIQGSRFFLQNPLVDYRLNNKQIAVQSSRILSHWTGHFYIFWKDFYNYHGNIPSDAPKESVFTLKMLLRDIGYPQIKLDQEYDDITIETVKRIQEKHGIEVDGIVGSKTKIVIYNENKKLDIPHIVPGDHSLSSRPKEEKQPRSNEN